MDAEEPRRLTQRYTGQFTVQVNIEGARDMDSQSGGNEKITLHIVAHTHWDREWYFTFEEFRYRLVKLMDTLLEFMETGEIEYFLFDGQTIALDDYLQIRPENRNRLEALVQANRLVIGPWYTQPNIFMCNAEAQIRNLLRGRKDMDKYGGGLYHVCYLPDQFGFHSQLPQMMAGFGMKHLVAWRGVPKGSPTYIHWQGSDHTVCDVCVLYKSYGNGCGLSPRMERQEFTVFGTTIAMPSLPDRLNNIMDEIKRAVAPHILAMNGVDHEFPNTSMKATLNKIAELYPDMVVKQSTLPDYIAAVSSSICKDMTTINGELRDPRESLILPASQSMRMDVKMYNQRMEDRLERQIEPLFSWMMSIGESSLPVAEFQKAWDYLLENQAHDSLCCSNSDPSWREIMVRYQKIDDLSREIQTELQQRLIRRINTNSQELIFIMNPSTMPRDEQMDIEVIVAKNRDFAEPHLVFEGKEIPTYVKSVRNDMLLRFVPFSGWIGQLDADIFTLAIQPGMIPASGYKVLEIQGGYLQDRPVAGIASWPDRMENEYLIVFANSNGTLDITDKRTDRTYKGVHCFIDDAESGDGFQHMSPAGDDTVMSTGRDLAISIGENTPIKAVIHIKQSFCVPAGLNEQMNARSETQAVIGISTDVILRSSCDWVEFKTHINNTARDHRLRVAFPTDIQSDYAFAGQPFDVVIRPIQPENAGKFSIEDTEPYVGYHPMSDFCGLSNGNAGVVIAGDGIIEYEVLPPRNALCLTLLRATDRLYGGVLAKGQKFKIPGAQLLCGLDYRYAFIPFAKNYENALPSVERFRHPLFSFQKDFLEAESMPEYQRPQAILPMLGKFIQVDSLCQTTAIKPAQDGKGIILRLYNPIDQVADITINVDQIFMIVSAKRARMDELDLGSIDATDHLIRLHAMPKECVTIRLLLKLLLE